jgi:hypothetical protein
MGDEQDLEDLPVGLRVEVSQAQWDVRPVGERFAYESKGDLP